VAPQKQAGKYRNFLLHPLSQKTHSLLQSPDFLQIRAREQQSTAMRLNSANAYFLSCLLDTCDHFFNDAFRRTAMISPIALGHRVS
jgi:hypothetical protein